MRLVFHCFGSVAFLEDGERVPCRGEIVVACNVPDGSSLVLYSEKRKEKREFLIQNGTARVPSSVVEGGCEVRILYEGETAVATPIQAVKVGEECYLVAGATGVEETLARICKAIVFVGESVRKALCKANEIDALKSDVTALKRRADSGDIIHF